jgi:hypothetical protein
VCFTKFGIRKSGLGHSSHRIHDLKKNYVVLYLFQNNYNAADCILLLLRYVVDTSTRCRPEHDRLSASTADGSGGIQWLLGTHVQRNALPATLPGHHDTLPIVASDPSDFL